MTPEQAQSFERMSWGNYIAAKACRPNCQCEPYKDMFTYRRWQALGFQVQRGEHSIRLPLVKYVTVDSKDGEAVDDRRIFGSSRVFCRCQVKPIEQTAPIPDPVPAPIVAETLPQSWQCGKCNKWFGSVRPERVIQNNGHTMTFITCNDCAEKMLKEIERPHKVVVPHYTAPIWPNKSYNIDTEPLCGKTWLEEHPNGHHADQSMTILYDGEDIGTFDMYSKRGDIKTAMNKNRVGG